MYGAIIGDLAGSIYEYKEFKDSLKKIINIERRLEILNKSKIIDENSFYSDDTILTIAILDAILNNEDFENKLKEYGLKYGSKKLKLDNYFEYMFSKMFLDWCKKDIIGTSKGNGCIMRVSPVGYLYNTIGEIKLNSKLATIPSHYNSVSIQSSEIVCVVIYLARLGYGKDYIKNYLNKNYKLAMEYDLDMLRRTNMFDGTCNILNQCLYILFISNNFEDSIRKAISIGGDTDTVACIVGSMAEALYGVPEYLRNEAMKKLPIEFNELLEEGYKKIIKLNV